MRQIREKKAQAAMEFLMTYGWAILAAIIVIGAIAYLYLSNVGGEAAAVSAPFVIDDWKVTAGDAATSKVDLIIRNGGAESITLNPAASGVKIAGCDATGVAFTTAPTDTLKSGESKTATVDCAAAIAAGSNFQSDIEITYKKSATGLDHKSTGSITTKAQ